MGLAPDGGLYHPASKPNMSELFFSLKEEFRKTSGDTLDKRTVSDMELFRRIAREVSYRILGPEIDNPTVERIVKKSFDFTPVHRRLDERLSLLELFHGPTCAFKDFGASFLANAMEELLESRNESAVILVATSGDTGGAVARAFLGKKRIDVVILYPSGRVSYLQEKQLTTLGQNITALEIKGSFDDCQRLVKEAFLDDSLNASLNLTSANSINLGRLIPQSFYYIYSYISDTHSNEGVTFTVPSGNFGNLTAGVLAWEWGLPVEKFIAATNVNDVVPQYLEEGLFKPRPSVETLSNAMDVGNPSNFERLRVIFDDNVDKMRVMLHGERVTDEETLEGMKEFYKNYGILIDPHTAVGYVASNRILKLGKVRDIVILSTAHPGKFGETVEEATGIRPELPENLGSLMEREKKSIPMEPHLKDLRDFLLKHFR